MNKELKVRFGKKQILNECTNEECRIAIIVHIKYIIYSIWFLIFKNNTMNAMNAMLYNLEYKYNNMHTALGQKKRKFLAAEFFSRHSGIIIRHSSIPLVLVSGQLYSL